MQVLHSGRAPSHFSLAARQASQARETRRFLGLPPFSVSFEVAAAFRARRFCGMLGWESRPSNYGTCNQQSTRKARSGQKHDSRSCNGEFRRDCFAKINENRPVPKLATSNWQLSCFVGCRINNPGSIGSASPEWQLQLAIGDLGSGKPRASEGTARINTYPLQTFATCSNLPKCHRLSVQMSPFNRYIWFSEIFLTAYFLRQLPALPIMD